MKRILKVFAVVGGINFAVVILNIISSKIRAVLLKPEGIGIFSQATAFSLLFIPLCSFGISDGVQKYTAEFKSFNEEDKIVNIIKIAIWTNIILGFFCCFFITVFSRYISKNIFLDEGYYLLLYIYSLGIPFSALIEILASCLVGYGSYASYAKGKLITTLLSIPPLFILLYLWGIKGAFIHYVLSSVIGVLVYLIFIFRVFPSNLIRDIHKSFFHIDRNLLKPIAEYGLFGLFNAFTNHFTVLFLRSKIIYSFGAEVNGYYQVIKALDSYLLLFISTGVLINFIPSISSLSNREYIWDEINKNIRFGMLILTPILFILLIYREIFIISLFTDKFIPSSPLFLYQMPGELFFYIYIILNSSLLARKKLKFLLIMTFSYNVFFILFFILLLDFQGVNAITSAFLYSNILFVIVNLLVHYYDINFVLDYENIKIISSSLILILIPIFSPIVFNININKIIYLIFLAGWCVFVISKGEYLFLKNYALSYIRR